MGTVNAGRRIMGKAPLRVDDVQGEMILNGLRKGFRTHEQR
jgi:hypothetical protein